MVMLREDFVILSLILNNVLYLNVPYEVQHIAICYKSCENRSEFALMKNEVVNDGYLPVFSSEIPPNVTKYKMKLTFHNHSERDSGWKFLSEPQYVGLQATTKITMNWRTERRNILIILCFTVSSLIVLFLKLAFRKIIRYNIE